MLLWLARPGSRRGPAPPQTRCDTGDVCATLLPLRPGPPSALDDPAASKPCRRSSWAPTARCPVCSSNQRQMARMFSCPESACDVALNGLVSDGQLQQADDRRLRQGVSARPPRPTPRVAACGPREVRATIGFVRLTAPGAEGQTPCLFLGSSTAEHPAVNRRVAGSNPARGANHFRFRLHSWLSVRSRRRAAPRLRLGTGRTKSRRHTSSREGGGLHDRCDQDVAG